LTTKTPQLRHVFSKTPPKNIQRHVKKNCSITR
jgi:hypothetical protein